MRSSVARRRPLLAAFAELTFVVFAGAFVGCKPTKPEEKVIPSAAPSAEVPKEVSAKAHCDVKDSLAFCSEYIGDVAPALKTTCELNHGIYGDGACSSTGVVGTCDLGPEERKRYYAAVVVAAGAKGKAFLPDSAEANCVAAPLSGKFRRPLTQN
jgi:hypothetical protein